MRRIIFLGALLIAACASATPSPLAPTAKPSPIAATAVPPSPLPIRTIEPGFTLVPSTPVPPTATSAPCNSDAKFLRDATVPDFTQIASGASIDKRWGIRNSGTCDWTREYRVVFVEGSSMGATNEHALFPSKAGSEAIVQIAMTAPTAPGDYTGKWQLRDAKGKNFGEVLFIKIKVVANATATSP